MEAMYQNRCPGCLRAKSLLPNGACEEDYVEWFSHPALSAHRPLVDAVYRAVQYGGDAPVLLVCDVSPESCLLFRFTMERRDRKGRSHQRYEALKICRAELPMLMDGAFKAVPEKDTAEFVVDGAGGSPLPEREHRRVGGVGLRVFARDAASYWFRSESAATAEPVERPSNGGGSKAEYRPTRDEHRKIKENGGRIMTKVLLLALVASCAFGGWNYVQRGRLHDRMSAMSRKIEDCREEMLRLRDENGRLTGKITKYDKWMKSRGNFELNKVLLAAKMDEIMEKFDEARSLMARMGEAPQSSPSQEKGGVQMEEDPALSAGGEAVDGQPEPASDGKSSGGGLLDSLKKKVDNLVH